jgi:hypothetical protein
MNVGEAPALELDHSDQLQSLSRQAPELLNEHREEARYVGVEAGRLLVVVGVRINRRADALCFS